MATANANAAPGATRPVDQHVEFVVKVSVRYIFSGVGLAGVVGAILGSFAPKSRFFSRRSVSLPPLSRRLISRLAHTCQRSRYGGGGRRRWDDHHSR